MSNGIARFSMIILLCITIQAGVCASASAKVPEGYRDIKLGMNKAQVVELLKKSPVHFSYDDLGEEIGEILRGDDLFRYATYKFNVEGILVEIGLQMREILGRDRVLELYNNQHGLQLTPLRGTEDADLSIEVHDNCLIMKKAIGKEVRSAKGPS